jgi:hypothetical protein
MKTELDVLLKFFWRPPESDEEQHEQRQKRLIRLQVNNQDVHARAEVEENPIIVKRNDKNLPSAELTQIPINAKSVKAPWAVQDWVFPTAPHHPVAAGVIQLPMNHQKVVNVMSYMQSPAMIRWYESTHDL